METHLATEVENVVKQYFDFRIDNFYNEKNNRSLDMKIKLELYDFLVLNDFYIDDTDIKDNKATVFIHSLFNVMKADFVLNIELVDGVLIIANSELIGLN